MCIRDSSDVVRNVPVRSSCCNPPGRFSFAYPVRTGERARLIQQVRKRREHRPGLAARLPARRSARRSVKQQKSGFSSGSPHQCWKMLPGDSGLTSSSKDCSLSKSKTPRHDKVLPRETFTNTFNVENARKCSSFPFFPGWNVSMTLSHPWLVGYSLRITSMEFCLCLIRRRIPPPVSYTHLDVYKRQFETCGIWGFLRIE